MLSFLQTLLLTWQLFSRELIIFLGQKLTFITAAQFYAKERLEKVTVLFAVTKLQDLAYTNKSVMKDSVIY